MTKLNVFNEKIRSFANASYKKHTFLKEWRVFILLTLILKVGAMVFSIFAGFFYFENLFITILNSSVLSKLFAVAALLLIEVLTAISLSKFFKFGIRLKFKKATPILLLACLFFSISFVSSTNGLALRQSRKIDNTTAITANHNGQKRQLTAKFEAAKERANQRRLTIEKNPQGWINGRRSTLTNEQLVNISGCYDEIKHFENNYNKDLERLKSVFDTQILQNNSEIESESVKYYKIVTVIMVLIFLVNGLLMFFYSRIYSETNKEAEAVEVVNDFAEIVNKKASVVIEENLQNTMNIYLNALGITTTTMAKTDKSGILTAETTANKQVVKEEPKRLNVVGFRPKDAIITAAVGRSKKIDNCAYCGVEFEKVVYNKKYCCESHKIKAWEENNNRKLNKKAKK